MSLEMSNGATVYREAYFRGQRPEPDVWIDQWADEYMRIPRDTGAAEPGQYHTSRTPYAREPMRCLSPAHPCKRVVAMVEHIASQAAPQRSATVLRPPFAASRAG